jgi:hypothetical protein
MEWRPQPAHGCALRMSPDIVRASIARNDRADAIDREDAADRT